MVASAILLRVRLSIFGCRWRRFFILKEKCKARWVSWRQLFVKFSASKVQMKSYAGQRKIFIFIHETWWEYRRYTTFVHSLNHTSFTTNKNETSVGVYIHLKKGQERFYNDRQIQWNELKVTQVKIGRKFFIDLKAAFTKDVIKNIGTSNIPRWLSSIIFDFHIRIPGEVNPLSYDVIFWITR